MKAVVITSHGDENNIKLADVPEPSVSDIGVLIEVRSAALNHLDIWVRKGGRVTLPMPHILGSDASGIVIAKGALVANLNIGEKVILNPGISCGACSSCFKGEQSECAKFGIVGLNTPGTFAEKVSVPAKNVLPKPKHLTFDEAAALPLAYLTAWRMLHVKAKLRPNETVLIHGIGGGVATAALLFAKLAQARVIVTSSSDEKLKRSKLLGADFNLNYKAEKNISEAIRGAVNGKGVDVIIDTVGASTWPINFDVINRGGRIVCCGITSGSGVQANLQKIYWNQIAVLGSTLGSDEDFRQMLAAVDKYSLHPLVDSVYPFDRAREAAAKMEEGRQFGKIVLQVTTK